MLFAFRIFIFFNRLFQERYKMTHPTSHQMLNEIYDFVRPLLKKEGLVKALDAWYAEAEDGNDLEQVTAMSKIGTLFETLECADYAKAKLLQTKYYEALGYEEGNGLALASAAWAYANGHHTLDASNTSNKNDKYTMPSKPDMQKAFDLAVEAAAEGDAHSRNKLIPAFKAALEREKIIAETTAELEGQKQDDARLKKIAARPLKR